MTGAAIAPEYTVAHRVTSDTRSLLSPDQTPLENTTPLTQPRRVLEKVRLLLANASVLSITLCRGIVFLALNGAFGAEHGLLLDQSAIVLASIAAISSLCATHARAVSQPRPENVTVHSAAVHADGS